jgi:hypothetical protein
MEGTDRFGVPHRVGVHLSHCNFGENVGWCKYGEEDCPAMSEEWRWFGDALAIRGTVADCRDFVREFRELAERMERAASRLGG